MTGTGLKEVSNPSAIFLSGNSEPTPGSVVTVIREGTRPILLELQALVDESHLSNPRRVTIGLDHSRLAMLLAESKTPFVIIEKDQTKTPKIEYHGFGPRTEAHLRRLFAVIRLYLDDLHANRYVYRPGWGCAMCDFVDSHCRT